MNILAVDDEKLMLGALVDSIHEAAPEASVAEFRNAKDALEYAESNAVDVAFLDIRMRGMDGLELAKRLMAMNPSLNVIFCTGYDEYISEAFREVRCNGYITKPVDAESVKKELGHLRTPLKTEDSANGEGEHQADKKDSKSRVRLQCFGYFAAFIDDEPIRFGSAKTLELLAYLVNACGGTCTNQDIITYLWDDDDEHDSYLKKLRKDLTETFEKYGCGDVICRQWGGMSIRTDKVECDYYEWKKHNTGKYVGDFMKQYYWVEY